MASDLFSRAAAFRQPVWKPSAAKGSASRPQSANSGRVNPWAAAAEYQKGASVSAPRSNTPRPGAPQQSKPAWNSSARPPRLATLLQTDRSSDSGPPPGHSVCGTFATLAQRGDLSPDATTSSFTDTRLDQLHRMIHHKFESQAGGNVVLPAFRRLSHEGREDDPRNRRAHARDLARFLDSCGAHATEAEAAQLLVNARGGSGSPDGKFGIHTFHNLARGANIGRAASFGPGDAKTRCARDFARTAAPPRPQSASREGSRSGAREKLRPRSASCDRGACAAKVGSLHWNGHDS